MRKILVSEFLSLDGVMQSPGNPEEDRSGGFTRGGWQPPYFDEALGGAMFQAMGESDAFLLGRKTYEIFAGFWPLQPKEDPMAATMNDLAKHVASTTLEEPLEWNNSHLMKGDVADEVKKLKQESGKDIQVIGSGDLVQTLMQHGLVDEFRLLIHPLVLGTGKRLFNDQTSATPMRLLFSSTTPKGVLILRYEPTGATEAEEAVAS
jgi:dihydrofolate reductase